MLEVILYSDFLIDSTNTSTTLPTVSLHILHNADYATRSILACFFSSPLLLPQQLSHPPSHLLNSVVRIPLLSYGQALPFPSSDYHSKLSHNGIAYFAIAEMEHRLIADNISYPPTPKMHTFHPLANYHGIIFTCIEGLGSLTQHVYKHCLQSRRCVIWAQRGRVEGIRGFCVTSMVVWPECLPDALLYYTALVEKRESWRSWE